MVISKIEVQDVISSFSLDQTLKLSIQLKLKWVATKMEKVAREMIEYTQRICGIIAGLFFVAKNGFYKERF